MLTKPLMAVVRSTTGGTGGASASGGAAGAGTSPSASVGIATAASGAPGDADAAGGALGRGGDVRLSRAAMSLGTLSSASRARAVLVGSMHGHAAPVLAVHASREWSIIVSGDESGVIIVWDLNRLAYVRALDARDGRIVALAVGATTGDIVSVATRPYSTPGALSASTDGASTPPRRSSSGGGGTGSASGVSSVVRLWSINGARVADRVVQGGGTCVAMSAIDAPLADLVAVGTDDGRVWLLAAAGLRVLRCVRAASAARVTALVVAPDASSVFVGDDEGLLAAWSASRPAASLAM